MIKPFLPQICSKNTEKIQITEKMNFLAAHRSPRSSALAREFIDNRAALIYNNIRTKGFLVQQIFKERGKQLCYRYLLLELLWQLRHCLR